MGELLGWTGDALACTDACARRSPTPDERSDQQHCQALRVVQSGRPIRYGRDRPDVSCRRPVAELSARSLICLHPTAFNPRSQRRRRRRLPSKSASSISTLTRSLQLLRRPLPARQTPWTTSLNSVHSVSALRTRLLILLRSISSKRSTPCPSLISARLHSHPLPRPTAPTQHHQLSTALSVHHLRRPGPARSSPTRPTLSLVGHPLPIGAVRPALEQVLHLRLVEPSPLARIHDQARPLAPRHGARALLCLRSPISSKRRLSHHQRRTLSRISWAIFEGPDSARGSVERARWPG